MTAPQTEAATDPQNIMALQQRLDAALAREAVLTEALAERTAELAMRNSAYGERIDHQAATIDVLKAMSASPSDPQPVFELIVHRACELCNGTSVGLFEYDGKLLHRRAATGGDEAANQRFAAMFPMVPTRRLLSARAILDRQIVHVHDMDAESDLFQTARPAGGKSLLALPLLRDGEAIGAIVLNSVEPGGFTDSQVALLQTFAAQAVIAITSAETYRALKQRTHDLQESLEYQTATSDVLKVISRSTFDLQHVFSTVVETAARLCDADQAVITRREGDIMRLAANFGFPQEYEAFYKEVGAIRVDPHSPSVAFRAWCERRPVHIHDVASVPGYSDEAIRLGKQRTSLGVPLLREGETVGTILLARQRVEPFTDRQIELVCTFADQAVIAIENARLLAEQREALEQQTATAEVLGVINGSPGDLAPVFDAILDKAHSLCGAAVGALMTFDGEFFRAVAVHGFPEQHVNVVRQPFRPNSDHQKLILGARLVHLHDLKAFEIEPGDEVKHSTAGAGVRTLLAVPLRKDGNLLGFISACRLEVSPFSEREIALLENFAAQAVIAMENARLLDEIRQRQEELRITFENMGDGVAMFDEAPRLVAWNRKFQELLDVPDAILSERRTYADYIRYLTERGEFGAGADPEEQIRRLSEKIDQYRAFERVRPDGRVIEVRHNPVPDGGFVLIYSDITERKRSEAEIRAARDAAESAYRELKTTQASLVQAEKMASLGQLTAGIAHEIKNPLNFVNNFGSLSVELLGELKDAVTPLVAENDQRTNVEEICATLTTNLEKIVEHGQRADGIVRGMLEHSRGTSGERRLIDLNTLVDEALNLAYHGARAQDQSFNVTLERDFGMGIAPIELAPQDMTRVLLNLFSNGFYATTKRAHDGARFAPTVKVSTRDVGDAVEIRVRDNGTGVPTDIKDKLFQPFFTTKPTGEGTGLGLSISYDIVTQQHSGTITVESKPDAFTEFTIRLPRR